MKTQLIGSDLAYAIRLHRRALYQAKEAAIAVGWTRKFVNEVANLDYSLQYLQILNRKGECSKKQFNAIAAVRNHASHEMLASGQD